MEAGRLVWDGNSGLLPLCFGVSQTPIIIKDPTSSLHSRSCPCPQSHVPLQKTMGSEGAFTHSMQMQGQKDADAGPESHQGYVEAGPAQGWTWDAAVSSFLLCSSPHPTPGQSLTGDAPPAFTCFRFHVSAAPGHPHGGTRSVGVLEIH